MPVSDLSELVAGHSEDLGVEYKAWIDTSLADVRAKLARHIAALANHGGGYLVIGVDDDTKLPMGETELDRRLFTQDAVAGIVQKYLDPRPQIRVEAAKHEGVSYPVLVIPSHGGRPVVALADGPPDEKKKPVGIRAGQIYVRTQGPQSVSIKNPDDWNALLDRCLTHRADLLGNIVRQAIARPGRASGQATELLLATIDATATDFVGQTSELADRVPADAAPTIRQAGKAFSILGYALVGDDSELREIDGIRALNDRVSVAMHRVAYFGWMSFLPLTVPERAPQFRTETVLGRERSYLEGRRLPSTAVIGSSLDYWRIYDAGVAVTAQSYWEDDVRLRDGWQPFLTVSNILFRLHSLLAHARLLGQETPGVQQVVVRMDWRGMTGRALAWDRHRIAPGRIVDDRYVKTVTLSWTELRDTYFTTLRRVALPFLDLFPSTGWGSPEAWLTRALVEREFASFGFDSVRLFDD